MKILVPVKHTVDYTMKVRVNAEGNDIVRDHLKFAMNPFDEIALEEAIRLLEKGVADAVEVLSIGDNIQETLRRALAFGATRAIHVRHEDPEPYHAAEILAAWVKQENYDLVLMGKQAIDNDCNQVGQLLAGFLGWSQATFASELLVEEDACVVTREVDAGLQKIRISRPAVVTADLRLNEPRYLSLPNIMKAKSRPIEEITAESLALSFQAHMTVLSLEAPPVVKKELKKASSISELLTHLNGKCEVLT